MKLTAAVTNGRTLAPGPPGPPRQHREGEGARCPLDSAWPPHARLRPPRRSRTSRSARHPSQTAPADAATSTTATAAAVPPMTRTYFIAADEVEWNYAPLGHNGITGEPFGDQENTFVANGPDRIGSTYRKALYREYTDASFTTLKPRPAADAYLGFLGPVIHAQVGDTLKIVFRNNTPLRGQHAPAQRPLRQEERGRPVRRRHRPGLEGRRRGRARRDLHLHVEGARARRPRPRRRLLRDVDVPLAHGRGRRHLRRPDRPDGDHARRHGEGRRLADRRRPRGVQHVRGRGREPEPRTCAEHPRASPATRPA